MRIILAKTYEDMSKIAAEEVCKLVNQKPNCVLGLATGSTPEGMYKELISLYKVNKVDFSKVRTINLDEYVDLNGDNEQSYRYFMNKHLFDHINIDKENTFLPNGVAEDMEEECKIYDKRISESGGIDLQILGIGQNGHIGFNEPSESLSISTHITNLSQDTIEANSRFFSNMEQVPKKAVTMGLGGIMNAREIILLASGEKKAKIISKLVEGNISTKVPASILQVHSNVVVIVDNAAAALLKKHHELLIEMV
jgi:glucosamine-6-phosphate deaminase